MTSAALATEEKKKIGIGENSKMLHIKRTMMVEAVGQTAKCLIYKHEDQTHPQLHIHRWVQLSMQPSPASAV